MKLLLQFLVALRAHNKHAAQFPLKPSQIRKSGESALSPVPSASPVARVPLSQVQSRSYESDGPRGFVVTASDVPASSQEPVRDTPEVARAKQEHLAAVAHAQALVGAVGAGTVPQGPQPVADTPEVAAARAQHLAIVQDTHALAQGRVAVLPHQSVSWSTAAPPAHQQWGGSSTPTPVQDTVEVAAAKAKHLAAVEEAKARVASAGASGYSHQAASQAHQFSGVSHNGVTKRL